MIVKNSCNTNRTKLQSSQYSNSPFIRHSFQRQLPSNGIFSRTAIYSSHWTKLVVFQPFARPVDSDHCAVCTLLLGRLCKYSVFHTSVVTNKSTLITMFSHMLLFFTNMFR